MTDHRLTALGDALERAAARDLAPTPTRRHRRVVGLVAAAVLVPGVAFGASALLSSDDVAQSLPRGTLFLVGTEPSCTTVKDQVEYDCTTAKVPVGEIAPGQFKGTVEPTVGADQRVNGGCRALDADGTHWRCYLGEEAVTQRIIGPDFLGQPSAGPGVG